MKTIIISTVNKIDDPKVRELTDRAIRSVEKYAGEWEIFDAITPEEYQSHWPEKWGMIAPDWIASIESKYTKKYPGLDWWKMAHLKATVSVSHHHARMSTGSLNTIIMEQDAVLLREPEDYIRHKIINLQHNKPWRYSCYVCNKDSATLWDNIHYTNGAYWCEDHPMFKQQLHRIMENYEGREPVSGGNEPYNSQIMDMVRE